MADKRPRRTGQYLFRDKAYVKLVEKALDKMEGLPKANRAIDALISQPDYEFLSIIDSNDPGYILIEEITKLENKLRKYGSPAPGTEGHHGVSLGSAKRTRLLPVKDRLQIYAIAESRGYPVGTKPHELKYLSQQAHGRQGDLFINPESGPTAHIDPWKTDSGNIVSDFKFWSKQNELNRPFDPSIDPLEAADRFIDETVGPQAMLSEAAMQRPSEVKARRALKGWLGIDNFAGTNLAARSAYRKLMEAANIDFTELVESYDRAAPLILPRSVGRSLQIDRSRYGGSGNLRDPLWLRGRGGKWDRSRSYGAIVPGAFGVDKLADYLKANWKGEVAGAILDPEVHRKLLEKDWPGAAREAIKGALIGGGIQAGLTKASIDLASMTPALAPLAIRNVANVYSKHTTGKDLEEHAIDIDKATNSSAGSGGYLSSSFGGPGHSEFLAASSLLSAFGVNPLDKQNRIARQKKAQQRNMEQKLLALEENRKLAGIGKIE